MNLPFRLAPPRRHNLLVKEGRLWPLGTELLGLEFELKAIASGHLESSYAKGLHAWTLKQFQQVNPELSAKMHDNPERKGFTLSRLRGNLVPEQNGFRITRGDRFYWSISCLSEEVVRGMHAWLSNGVDTIRLQENVLKVEACRVELKPQTYAGVWRAAVDKPLTVSFLSPTSFRRKGQHLPIPWPFNLFQSYLRRWQAFTEMEFARKVFGEEGLDAEVFLAWIDEGVVFRRHELRSEKVAAGKRGMVTGFVGAVELGLSSVAREAVGFTRLFGALGAYAPYCGTGHKTTFGLGQTRLGWLVVQGEPILSEAERLAARIEVLEGEFFGAKQRRGGNRARKTAKVWGTVLARREMGESLGAIARDLGMRYETVKTYVKLARRVLRERGM